jgi:hypothetical protein
MSAPRPPDDADGDGAVDVADNNRKKLLVRFRPTLAETR